MADTPPNFPKQHGQTPFPATNATKKGSVNSVRRLKFCKSSLLGWLRTVLVWRSCDREYAFGVLAIDHKVCRDAPKACALVSSSVGCIQSCSIPILGLVVLFHRAEQSSTINQVGLQSVCFGDSVLLTNTQSINTSDTSNQTSCSSFPTASTTADPNILETRLWLNSTAILKP